MKKKPAHIIILHMRTKNLLRDVECDGLKLVILGHFCNLTPLKTQKFKILEKMKKISSCVPEIKIKSFDVWLLRYGMRHNFFFLNLAIFCLFTLLMIQKIKIL